MLTSSNFANLSHFTLPTFRLQHLFKGFNGIDAPEIVLLITAANE
jgi:hypothetical protein